MSFAIPEPAVICIGTPCLQHCLCYVSKVQSGGYAELIACGEDAEQCFWMS